MAGLAAAFDLTRTQALRDQFDVTIYQLGWRLGGKAASGRLPDGRIVEHGLHVWFGCYENAFELVRAAYEEWTPQKDQAITDCGGRFREADPHRDRLRRPGRVFPASLAAKPTGAPETDGEPLAFWPCVSWSFVSSRSSTRQSSAH